MTSDSDPSTAPGNPDGDTITSPPETGSPASVIGPYQLVRKLGE